MKKIIVLIALSLIAVAVFAAQITCPDCNGTGTITVGKDMITKGKPCKCELCKGTGKYDSTTCLKCKGKGSFTVKGKLGSTKCPDCKGTGKVEPNVCAHCHGIGKDGIGGPTCPYCHGTGKNPNATAN